MHSTRGIKEKSQLAGGKVVNTKMLVLLKNPTYIPKCSTIYSLESAQFDRF